ncbi:WXG100 family type VII secretion target [Paenarthrobacter sp. NPDC056912]|uniref:WXG100 family type VII secretion target n=1 Tax=Paenarthrobacter sp. NPDC056912 TaxID=3345965 RepID=UPI00366BE4DE
MGQGLVGADVGDLRRLSAVMDAEAEKMTDLRRQLNVMIQGGNYWRGADADQFRSAWQGDLHGRLGAAVACLKSNARALRLNAEQQEQASLGGPGGGPGGSGKSSGNSPSGTPGYTVGPTTYGPVTVEGNGSIGVEGKGETHGNVGPGGISAGGSGEVSAGAEMTWTATSAFGPVKTTTTNETFVGGRADGSYDARVPFGLGLPSLNAKGEAFAGLENNTTTKSEFFDGWATNTSTARFMTGVEAGAHANADSPFLFGAGGEVFAGQKITIGNETEFAGGLFGFGQGTELRGGAWASAGEGEVNVSKGGSVTGGAASAGAGAELTASRYVEVLGQKFSASGTVAAGVGEGYFFNASMDEDGLTLGVGAKITAELGLGAGAQVTLSPSGFVDSVTGFVNFLAK